MSPSRPKRWSGAMLVALGWVALVATSAPPGWARSAEAPTTSLVLSPTDPPACRQVAVTLDPEVVARTPAVDVTVHATADRPASDVTMTLWPIGSTDPVEPSVASLDRNGFLEGEVWAADDTTGCPADAPCVLSFPLQLEAATDPAVTLRIDATVEIRGSGEDAPGGEIAVVVRDATPEACAP